MEIIQPDIHYQFEHLWTPSNQKVVFAFQIIGTYDALAAGDRYASLLDSMIHAVIMFVLWRWVEGVVNCTLIRI